MKYTSPRGTRDILPEECDVWRYITDTIVNIFNVYNVKEIKTPIFESAELFQRAVGDQTDIVEKEMYVFEDKGKRVLALRPEGTASVVRAYLQNLPVFQKNKLVKLFYNGPMFRYERPQTGRYRQFYQIGVEAIGSSLPLIDAEVMIMGVQIFKELGIEDINIAVHSVGCDVCRPVIRERLKDFVASILPHLCTDCQNRYEKNPLRILDCKNPTCQTYFAGMPDMANALCHECNDHFIGVLNLLEENQIPHEVDSHLVRGLDYYTKTVFEIRSNLLGAQNAICGGGRYDTLIEEMGGKPTPAFGFAIGMDRLYMVFNQLNLEVPDQKNMDVYIVGVGAAGQDKSLKIASTLRKHHIYAEMCLKGNSIKNGLREAVQLNARYVIIIGENEIETNSYTVKNLEDKTQFETGDIEEIIKLIQK
ncbi:MAG: histidine--tRNA ligase [Candidatus Margulisbacteria bacterium GWF2_35_9]|nr:MAG: histidine--tRNA ligase [Candidatus Margulisbacteria bacterium GWF2_35_9]